MNAVEVVFILLGALALGAGAFAVTTTRVIHAALWLALSLAAVAGCYLLLTAELLAWVQVLIYVGAVVVLVLFALMLTRAPVDPAPPAAAGRVRVAATVAAGTAAILLVTVLAAVGDERIDLEAAPTGDGEAVGGAVFSAWVLPFELLSVLLLAALVGAVVLARRRSADSSGDEGR